VEEADAVAVAVRLEMESLKQRQLDNEDSGDPDRTDENDAKVLEYP
jgi:hypothetical protein